MSATNSDGSPKKPYERSYSIEVTAGVAVWIAGLVIGGLGAAFLMDFQGPGSNQAVWPYWVLPILILLGEASLTWQLAQKGWRGFLPGLLLGAALTCLIPSCICGMLIATMR